MLDVRPETDKDISNIRQTIIDAFAEVKVASLVEAIRNSPNFIPELSLVAAENGEVLGHILFSRIIIAAHEQSIPALALAPLAVTPNRQRQGIGSKLVEAGLSKCRELDHSIAVVVGNPSCYQRFGFQTANKFNLHSSLPFPDEAFMALEFKPRALINAIGTVMYPIYFHGL
ncbi:MAG: N-acetyltransferase [Cyanomargarita calcarea GSE-NOS-MK-12-04C]|jgi:putative acetyltransferase|uniref:N-acetyltransferase n=1 Tax=Cyanomargarita calcarea GSE-NOS-MK-12-04C TaxID=2839659 RepID=A0A951UU60_9CYAN|nr:N-acetyltransferase [Cyanomargarita calcarea GSE-NOS-MK-12-04C]